MSGFLVLGLGFGILGLGSRWSFVSRVLGFGFRAPGSHWHLVPNWTPSSVTRRNMPALHQRRQIPNACPNEGV